MKILYYSSHPQLALKSQSGYGTHMREMINAFQEVGHEVFPLIMGADIPDKNYGHEAIQDRTLKNYIKRIAPGLFWETLKDLSLLRKDRRFTKELDRVVSDFSPDLIYERSSRLQLSGIRVATRRHIPHVLEVNAPVGIENEYYGSGSTLLGRYAEWIEKKQLNRTNKVAVVSSAMIDYFVKKYGILADEFITTPSGINPGAIKTDEERVREITSTFSLANKFVVGFVGSIIKWQRVDLLIHACCRLVNVNPQIVILIVGNSELVPSLKELSESLGVAKNVVFVGRVPHHDIFNFIEAMDITVLPDNLWYGSPTKIFEYGALGKPVIAPDNTTNRNLIEQGRDGLLVRPDATELSAAIAFLMADKEVRARMGKSFQRIVQTRYTWKRNAEKVLDVRSVITLLA